MLALLLPALLAPAGWSLRLCFCAAMRGAATEAEASCCGESAARGCCGGAEAPARPGQAHRECGSCKRFGNEHRGLPPGTPSAPEVPPAIAFDLPQWTLPGAVEALGVQPRVVANTHSPPSARPATPLRI